MKILVTGGAGFIGSAVCRHLMAIKNVSVVNVDKLTYAANPRSLNSIASDARYAFQQADICDRATMDAIFAAISRQRLSIWPQKVTSTDRSPGPTRSLRRILSAHTGCLRPQNLTTRPLDLTSGLAFVLSMYQRTRFTDRSELRGAFARIHLMSQARLIRRARPHPIISRTHGTRLMDCRLLYRIVPTITGRTSSPRSLSR